MGKLFDEGFYAKDFDQDMLDYIKSNLKYSVYDFRLSDTFLKYSIVNNKFWTSNNFIHCPMILTKQQFKEKIGMVDNNTPAESITDPVAEPDDELVILSYQDIIDKCKNTNTNLVITGEGVYILDCINSVEYKVESDDDYEDIINAIELLQRKEVGYEG